MSGMVEIQDAYDELAREHMELTFASYAFGSFLSAQITTGAKTNPETLAQQYDALAVDAGKRFASLGNDSYRPNRHLEFLAEALRQMGKPGRDPSASA